MSLLLSGLLLSLFLWRYYEVVEKGIEIEEQGSVADLSRPLLPEAESEASKTRFISGVFNSIPGGS